MSRVSRHFKNLLKEISFFLFITMDKSTLGPIHYVWFAAVGSALAVVIVVLCIKEYAREWKHHQAIARRLQIKAVEEKIKTLESELPSVNEETRAKHEDRLRMMKMIRAQALAMPVKIQQIQVDSLKRVDRCTTCHTGIEDVNMNAHENPYKGHPGKYLQWHDIEKFGCTICHEGQGLSTDYMHAAHKPLRGLDRPWQKAVLSRYLIQSSCGKCHLDKEVPFAPLLSKGRDVIEKAGCSGCHKIRLYESQEKVGPSLDLLGSKVNRAWLLRWLSEPREYDPSAGLIRPRMPKFNLSKDQILALEAFLMASRNDAALKEPVEGGDPEAGALLFRESRCVTCHLVEGKGGYLGPELAGITSKVSKKWLYSYIKDTHFFQPRTKMPQFNFTEKQMSDIVEYLCEELQGEELEIPEDFENVPDSDKNSGEMVNNGKKIFMDYGCTGCHAKTGIDQGRIAPDIIGLGSRDEEGLEWGNVHGIDKYTGNWVFARLKDPILLDKKAKMPVFPFTEDEMAAATVALLSDTMEDIPSQYIVSATNRNNYPDLPGEFGKLVDKYRCRSCHVVYGDGGWVSMHPLDGEGSEVRKEWLRGYFTLPYTLRPILAERMVNLKMSDSEIDLLVNFFGSVMVLNSIPVEEYTFKEEEIAKGKSLFDKYGCISCHIMGKGGGYVGPPLTTVGDRLTTGWIYEYIKNPRYYETWSLQPDYGFSAEDARALTAYLASCKEVKKDIRISQGK